MLAYRTLLALLCAFAPFCFTSLSASAAPLSLEEAIEKALVQSPRLLASKSASEAAKGERRQASAWKNPELGAEAENFAGTGPYKAFSSADITYSVSQTFELGGKIGAREKIAQSGLDIANLDYQAAALDLIRDVTIAYMAAAAADETVKLAAERETLARRVSGAVARRVDAAAAPLIQKSRAEVELANATLAHDSARRAQSLARQRLALLLGEAEPGISPDSEAFYTVTTPDLTDIEARLRDTPEYKKLELARQQSMARYELERANAVPDPSVYAGFRDFRDNGHAFVVGLSIPIPVLNANRGNIEKARNEVSRADYQGRDAELLLRGDVLQAEQKLRSAELQIETLHSRILPAARKAFALAQDGYERGRFSHLEVLDAQRSLSDARVQEITALQDFHEARAQIERLTMTHLNRFQNGTETHAQ